MVLTGLAEKLVRVADDYLASKPDSEEELTGRYWVVEQIIRQRLKRKEQLVIFSEHLANLDSIAGLMNQVLLAAATMSIQHAIANMSQYCHLWHWNIAYRILQGFGTFTV